MSASRAKAVIPPRAFLLAVPAVLTLQALILWVMGRPLVCACGYVKLWHGIVHSSENSQHIFDWYTFTHIIHGFGLYFLTWLALGKAAFPIRLALAVLLEGIWEVVENTDFIILRYRAATTSFDYFGDSIVNSIADSVTMVLGFMAASRLPGWSTVAIAIIIELALGYLIRDNLTLNVITMVLRSEAIRAWQAGAPLR
jgi:hypothetical protein